MSVQISLCMIVKNEESNLKTCLDTVADIVDEINIIDTGSEDRTIEIAKEYTDRIFRFEWIDDFAAARNFSFSKATKDYIMWLDADDIILEQDKLKIKELKSMLNEDIDYVITSYNYKQDSEGNPLLIQERARFFKRDADVKWEGAIHEIVNTENLKCLTRSDIFITHNKTKAEIEASDNRNLNILMEIINSGKATPRDHYYLGMEFYKAEKNSEALLHLETFFNKNFEMFKGIDAYMAAVNIFYENQEYEKAYNLLVTSSKLFSDSAEYYCTLGDFFYKIIKDIPASIKEYKKALKCRGRGQTFRYEDYYYFLPYTLLGRSYASMGNYQSSLEYYRRALKYRISGDKATESIISKLENLINDVN